MTALLKNTPFALCARPSVSFGPTSYEKTFSENIVSDEAEIATKTMDGPNAYTRFFAELVEAYIKELHRSPARVRSYLGDESIKAMGDTIRMSLDGVIDLIRPTLGYSLIYGGGRLNVAHLEKLKGLRDVIRIAQLEIRFSELIEEQVQLAQKMATPCLESHAAAGLSLAGLEDHGDRCDHADHRLILANHGLDPNENVD
jgi:hypothetical protein